MTLKNKLIIGSVAMLSAFAAGRYTVPTKIVTEIKTVEVEKKTDTSKKDIAKKTKKHTKTVIDIKPSGEKTITTTTDSDTSSDNKSASASSESSQKDESSSKTVESNQSKVTISALAGINPFQSVGVNSLLYGASLTKPVFGPFTLGTFVFSNGLIGASAGLTF